MALITFQITSMYEAKIHMGYYFYKDWLVVAGGFDSKGDHVRYAELYHDTKNEWVRFESPIHVGFIETTNPFLTRVESS